MTAEYQVHGDVAVITLNNPPVNGLGLSTRQAIADGLEKAENDAAVKAIVLTGAGKAFSGGADIREFGSPKAIQEPNLLSVITRVENTTKPVIAAVNGANASKEWLKDSEPSCGRLRTRRRLRARDDVRLHPRR